MFERRGKLALIAGKTPEKILVAGDIHGDVSVFRRIIASLGPRDLAVFLGDYADRGPSGLEVLEGLAGTTNETQGRLLPLKGNHENYAPDGKPLFHPCTLIGEAMEKGHEWKKLFPILKSFFDNLPLAAVIPGFALLVHGGISESLVSLDAIENPTEETESDIIWSDPDPFPGQHPNPRGAGRRFGPDITKKVLDSLGVRFIIRSHEPRKATDGPCFEHGGRVITTSATRIYGGKPFMLVLPGASLPGSPEEVASCVEYLK